jgi:acyl-CoA thioesterase
LLNIQLVAIRNGIFHGHMTIFSREGHLIALAGQSGVVREL